MNGFGMVAFLCGSGAIYSFLSGVRAMTHGGQRTSAVWMTWRVVFQSAAVVTVLAALLAR
jgi:hypothetical protein